jgi:hypothetical protein
MLHGVERVQTPKQAAAETAAAHAALASAMHSAVSKQTAELKKSFRDAVLQFGTGRA